MIVLAHATGNENVRQAAVAFARAHLLSAFWTSVSWDPASWPNKILPRNISDQLSRRSFPPELRHVTYTRPGREICRLFSETLRVPQLARGENAPCSIERVMKALDHRVADYVGRSENCRGVYAYEDGALHSFRRAKQTGKHCLYDLPIGYWRAARAIYQEECERQPQWAATLTGAEDSEEKRARKEEELQLTERIIVASSFTRSTLPPEKQSVTHVIPYGAPEAGPERTARPSGKLRLLYVGSLGQRKGLSYLLEAVKHLGSAVELTMIGRKTAEGCRPLDLATQQHRWMPSLPRRDILREMQQHHILALPSLFEGFGLVLTEAMAQGLPVLATAHTAAPDLIDDGREGFIVPIRSPEAIGEKLQLLHREPERCLEMAHAARAKALTFSWEQYRQRLVAMAREVISPQAP